MACFEASGGTAMLQGLGDHIANCLVRAADAERRASEATDAAIRADNQRMARAWRHIARSYEFIESLERFLLDASKTRGTLERLHLLRCPKCDHEMRLMVIEPDSDNRDLFTVECTACGHQEVMGALAK
jgi:hypothetical protein